MPPLRLLAPPLLLGLVACQGPSHGDKTPGEGPPPDSGPAHDTDRPTTESDCGDRVDNDADGKVDCEDLDCAEACTEDCTNGADDDADLLVDCEDPDCAEACTEDCTNGTDDDADGLTDCEDPDCAEACTEDCTNGTDDDADGLADCEDPECTDACPEDCTNGTDDDADLLADCDDPECTDTCPEDCTNGTDDDADLLADCDDPECTDACPEDCTNGADDDADGLADCADAECVGTPLCLERCDDGIDNDVDGLVDCEDADCIGEIACSEACGDGVDNDADGLTDCEDDECWPDCATVTVAITGAAPGLARRRHDHRYTSHSVLYRSERDRTSTWQLDLPRLSGELRVSTGSGSVTTCSWWASSVAITGTVQRTTHVRTSILRQNTTSSLAFTPAAVGSSGGCALAPTRFLPTRLFLPLVGSGSATTAPVGIRLGGARIASSWFHLPIGRSPLSGSQTSVRTSSGHFLSSSWHRYSSVMTPTPGTPLTLSSVALP